MTIDSATPIQIHTVAGIGPYAAGWPYADGGIFVGTVGADGTVTWLASSNYTVAPASSDTSGNVFLAPAAAAALDGQILYLERNTAEEQGWIGHLSARERGLEAQLDIMVMSAQERRSLADRSLRATVPILPFVPGPTGTVLIRTETGYGTGPAGDQIASAQQHGVIAGAAAAAALEAQHAAEEIHAELEGSLWLISRSSTTFDTVAAATGETVPLTITHIGVLGFSAAGDGGAARYMRVGSEPAHAGKLQTSDGAWWELFADRVNVRQFGAHPGATAANNVARINAAIDYVAAKGGGTLYVPAGEYSVNAAIVIKTNVTLVGGGGESTILKLANGANTNVVQTEGWAGYIGTDTTDAAPHDFGLIGFVLDGNRANQSPVDPNLCNGLAIFGYKFTLANLIIRNIAGHGIRSEWGTWGGYDRALETFVSNVIVDTTARHGVWWNGPHDAHLDHVIVIDASQAANASFNGVTLGPKGSSRWFNLHCWHRSGAVNRVYVQFFGENAELICPHLEGGNRQLRVDGGVFVRDARIYANWSLAGQILVNGSGNCINGSFTADAANPRPVTVDFGPAVPAANSVIDLNIWNHTGGASAATIAITSSGGGNKVRTRCANGNTTGYFTGSWATHDVVEMSQSTGGAYRYERFLDGTTKSA